jgi:hypothetical protein
MTRHARQARAGGWGVGRGAAAVLLFWLPVRQRAWLSGSRSLLFWLASPSIAFPITPPSALQAHFCSPSLCKSPPPRAASHTLAPATTVHCPAATRPAQTPRPKPCRVRCTLPAQPPHLSLRRYPSTSTLTMSESRLDQSLESIISSRKQSTRKGRGGRRSDAGRPAATAAPVGGVKKSTKQPKQPKAAPAGPAAAVGGESKIMISNLVRCPVQLSTRRTPLTQSSRWTSSRTNFRYVRPLQVFEPTLVALCARTRPNDEIELSP